MKKDLRFYSHVAHFKPDDNFFTYILNKKYNIIIDPNNPDLTISYHDVGKNKNAVNIRYTGEVDQGIMGYDYCLYPLYMDDPRYIYMAGDQTHMYEMVRLGFATWDTFFEKKNFTKDILKEKTEFCCFMYLHGSKPRDKFFERVSEYKFVHAPGERFNNVKRLRYNSSHGNYGTGHIFSQEKREYIKPFKFVFGFDSYYPNQAEKGYVGQTSEKIVDPYITHNVPLYWGNPRISERFNTKSMINYFDFSDEYYNETVFDDMLKQLIEIDKDDDKYIAMLNENAVDKKIWDENIEEYLSFFEKIIGF